MLGLVGAWVLAELLAPTGAGPSPATYLAGSLWFGFFGAAGAFLLHLASSRPRREKLAAASVGTLAAVALALAGRDPAVVVGIGLGAGSIAVLGATALIERCGTALREASV